jgi:ATP-dependent Clp protease ATP-binding subunit ClpA
LSKEIILRVVDKFLDEVDGQLAEKRVELKVSDEVKAWFAEHGYDRAFGARPMARLIQDKLKVALADELLFGKLEHGGIAHVTLENGEIKVHCEAAPVPAPVE